MDVTKPLAVSSTLYLDKLDAILYERPAGRNIIAFAVDEILALRARVSELEETASTLREELFAAGNADYRDGDR